MSLMNIAFVVLLNLKRMKYVVHVVLNLVHGRKIPKNIVELVE